MGSRHPSVRGRAPPDEGRTLTFMKSLLIYAVTIALSILLLYIYNLFVPKNLLTFMIGLPIYVGIVLWVVRLFEKKQGAS